MFDQLSQEFKNRKQWLLSFQFFDNKSRSDMYQPIQNNLGTPNMAYMKKKEKVESYITLLVEKVTLLYITATKHRKQFFVLLWDKLHKMSCSVTSLERNTSVNIFVAKSRPWVYIVQCFLGQKCCKTCSFQRVLVIICLTCIVYETLQEKFLKCNSALTCVKRYIR